MVTVTVKLDDVLLGELDSLAQKKELNRSAAIRQALADYTAGAKTQYGGIPPELNERVEFLMLLLLEGTPDKDWSFVREEVMGLWNLMRSRNS